MSFKDICSSYIELPINPLSDDEAHLRVLLELDADQGAAQNNIAQWREYWNRKVFPALSPISAEKAWVMSIAMIFLIMDSQLTSVPTFTSHPPPLVRMIHLANLAGAPARPEFIGPEDVFLEAFLEVAGWWRRSGLRSSGGNHGIEIDKTVALLNEMRSELQTRYASRLDEYRDERLKR